MSLNRIKKILSEDIDLYDEFRRIEFKNAGKYHRLKNKSNIKERLQQLVEENDIESLLKNASNKYENNRELTEEELKDGCIRIGREYVSIISLISGELGESDNTTEKILYQLLKESIQ